MTEKMTDRKIWNKEFLYIPLLILIALYPLRWARTGLDLWDIGYSCGNYVNFNTISISRPWFYSTYLSLLVGHLLSYLPYGNTLTGLKILCGLVASVTVIVSGLFCIRKLKLPAISVLIGEAWAVSICYIPTVILYNHLTFLFFVLAVIFLYIGLTENKQGYLFLSGIFLALNVFVRISNLPQALLILAVWYYLFLDGSSPGEYIKKTLICMAGYTAVILLMLAVIAAQYGSGEYVAGIRGMLSISDHAGDYSAVSMLKELILAYVHGGSRLAYTAVASFLACILYKGIRKTVNSNKEWAAGDGLIRVIIAVCSIGLIAFMLIRKLMIFDFYHYATVYYTVAMFLDIALILSLLVLFDKRANRDKKLIWFIVLLQMIVMSIGSGTGISPVMNSAYLIGPCICMGLYECLQRFVNDRGEYRHIVAGVAAIVLISFLIQCIAFGMMYEFEEAGNGAGGRYTVEGNRVLGRTRTGREKAEQIQGLSDHIRDEGLTGSDCIIYGYAPALAFYMELRPAITSWPDLDSYGKDMMEEDIASVAASIDTGTMDHPVIIFDVKGIEDQKEHDPGKWEIINSFMDRYGYTLDWSNERFELYMVR